MILFLHVFFFFIIIFGQKSHLLVVSDVIYLHKIHNICQYFEFMSVHIQKISKNKCLVKINVLAVCLLG